MSNNARFVSDVTIPDGTRVKVGESFTKVWRVENNGSAAWGAGCRLVHAGGEPLTTTLAHSVPDAAVGQQIELSLTLTAPSSVGNVISQWRLQNAQGNPFGQMLFLEINVVPEVDTAWTFDPAGWRETIWAITSIFESGRPEGNAAAYQTVDAGIISYGKHQATLASGTLSAVVEAYLRRSNSPTSQTLRQEYAGRIANKDATLRHDNSLRQLLLQAAEETAMAEAQDEVFEGSFYQPAVNQAQRHNVSSPLGLACLYDTHIQGGLLNLLNQVKAKLGGIIGQSGPAGTIQEQDWIDTFLNLREQRLLQLAQQSEARGDQVNAAALRTSTFRVKELRKLLQAGNLALAGELLVRQQKVRGTTDSDKLHVEVSMPSNARYIADVTIPDDTAIVAGKGFTKTWRVQNTGDTTWGAGYKLVHINGVLMAKQASQPVPAAAPGKQVEISVQMTAPGAEGIQFTDWRLQDAQGSQFGDILYARIAVEPAPAGEPAAASNSRFVADVTIPDDTQLAPGASFTKTWRVQNSGQSPWGAGFTLNFIGGTAMTTQVSHPLPAVAPGAQADISIEMKAPTSPGSYYGDWRMKDSQGNPFGEVVYLRVVVPSPAGTSMVAPISQRDPLWVNKKLGYSGSNKTIGEWGCLMTCLTMVANRYGYSITPSQFNDAMLRRRGFIEPNLTKWNALNNVYQDIVYEGKIDASANILDRINASLAQGNPVTVQVDFTRDTPYTDNDQHWVLIVGRDGDDYRINDPWLLPPQEASLRDRYARTGRPLREAIMSAVFYRCAKITKPVEVPPVDSGVAVVSSHLQTGMNVNPDAPNSNPMDTDDLKGMDWVRFVFKLAARENPAERDDIGKAFEQYDSIVSKYDRMGIKSLIVLNQETVWGNAPWSGNNDWATYASQLAEISRQIAARYKRYGERVAYEIWNEGDLPNNPASIFIDPAQFAIVLKQVAETIRSVSPSSPLIFGGLATGTGDSIPYLKRCLAALNGQWPVDAIGIHPYGAWATRAPFDWAQHFGTLGQQFEQYKREIPGIPLWITEIGVAADDPIGPPHYETIGNYIKDVYKHVGERYVSLVPVLIWFAWSDWMRNSGIVERDGRKKEHVYAAFRDVRNREF